MPTTSRDWLSTIASVRDAVAAKRYDDADKELASFTDRHAGTPEAREADYWRAVYELDPDNPNSSPGRAIANFKHYLADSLAAPHRAEAVVLRRLAVSLDSAEQARKAIQTGTPLQAAPPDQTEPAPSAHELDLEKEVQRLKDELDQSNAELERIKKRLVPPPP